MSSAQSPQPESAPRSDVAPSPALAAKAKRTLDRLSAAISLNTVFTTRLTRLRNQLVREIGDGDGAMLSMFLGEFGDAIDGECRSADRAHVAKFEAAKLGLAA